MYELAARVLVEKWLALYKHFPVLTVFATILILAGAGTAIYYDVQRSEEQREARRREDLDFTNQLASLDEVESNIRSLLQFVKEQKTQLQQTETALNSLKAERERLQPIIEADRDAIEAIFSAQEERNRQAQTEERWLGFALGVIASLIASFIWAVVSYVLRKGGRPATTT